MCGSCPVASLSTEWGFLYSSSICKRQNFTLPHWPVALKYQVRVSKSPKQVYTNTSFPLPLHSFRCFIWVQVKQMCTFYVFIPCQKGRRKVQAAVWCHSSLWSKCPPMPRGTPPPVQENTVRLSPANWPDGHVKARGLFQYLHLILSKNAIEDEVSPEHRPLTFNVLKQLQLCGIVVQPSRVLEGQRSQNYSRVLQLRLHRPQPQHSAGMI